MAKKNRDILLKFDRILSSNLWKQGLVLMAMMFVAFLLSYAMLSLSGSDWVQFCEANRMSKWTLPLFLLIDPNVLNNLYIYDAADGVSIHGWMLIASIFTYILGIFLFSGMIISLITNSISRRVDDHRSGRIFYLRADHYIIMGYDDMVPAVIDDIFSRDKDAYVLLLTAVNAGKIREWLSKSVAATKMERIIINYGHRTMSECYPKIHLETAKEIFIVGRRDIATHDAMNVENVDSICRYLKQIRADKGEQAPLPRRITCVFEDLDTYTAFKTTEIFDDVRKLGIELVPYNFYSGWAKQVFVKGCHKNNNGSSADIQYPPMLREQEGEERYVHLLFGGITLCSVAMAIEAAHVLHFPLRADGTMRKTRITFIDNNADTEMQQFVTRYRHFFDVEPAVYEDLTTDTPHDTTRPKEGFLDVEFHFIKGNIFSASIQQRLCQYATDPHQSLAIFLAMRNPKTNFSLGMNLPDTIYFSNTPIFIRQDRSDNFVTNLRNQDRSSEKPYYTVADGKLKQTLRYGRYSNIYPFGMTNTGFCGDNNSMKHAKLINYLYCNDLMDETLLDAISSETIMADANRLWTGLTVALKWSNLYNAYSFAIKLQTLRKLRGLDLDDASRDRDPVSSSEADILATMEHNRWNVEKLLMGYSKARPEEDKYEHREFEDKLKENRRVFIHHDIRPYKDLDHIKENDLKLTQHLPWILKTADKI